MQQYQLIDHTADIGVIARGETMAQAFGNAALGMFSIVSDLAEIKEMEIRHIEVNGEDLESLLVNWLNELVYIFDVEHFLFGRFEVNELAGSRLQATCYGEKYDPLRHHLKTGIKSATYHMLEVNRIDNCVKVIFDI